MPNVEPHPRETGFAKEPEAQLFHSRGPKPRSSRKKPGGPGLPPPAMKKLSERGIVRCGV
jgi:hypothetical protein